MYITYPTYPAEISMLKPNIGKEVLELEAHLRFSVSFTALVLDLIYKHKKFNLFHT